MIEKAVETSLRTAEISVFPSKAIQTASLPYVVYRRISTRNMATVADGEGTLDAGRVQLNCYAANYGATKTLAASVKAAIKASFGAKAVKVHESDEDDNGKNWVWLDYSIWMQRNG